jgi:hypothetical protein
MIIKSGMQIVPKIKLICKIRPKLGTSSINEFISTRDLLVAKRKKFIKANKVENRAINFNSSSLRKVS